MDKNQCQQTSDSESDIKNGISLEVTEFSLEVLKNLSQNGSNIAFSPVSIYTLLGVLHQGSNGSSRVQMDQTLHKTAQATGDAVKNLNANIENSDTSPSLKLLWKTRKNSNRDSTPEKQQASCQQLEEEQSSSPKIPFRSSSKTFGTLANMLCFNGSWSQEGLLKCEMDFSPSPEDQFQTEGIQMKKSCFYGISEDVGAQWINIPIAVQKKSDDTGQCVGVRPSCRSYWSKRKLSLLVILPTTRHGLKNLIQDLTIEHLMKAINYSAKVDRKNLELTLPAFHINSTTDFKPVLKKLGLESVFGSISGLRDASAKQRLFLSNVMQKGQIVVDQYGARTAEQTETNFPSLFCEPWEETEPCSVDEPFLFFVVDNETSLPLIAGKVTKPQPSTWEPLDNDDYGEDDDFSQCREY